MSSATSKFVEGAIAEAGASQVKGIIYYNPWQEVARLMRQQIANTPIGRKHHQRIAALPTNEVSSMAPMS